MAKKKSIKDAAVNQKQNEGQKKITSSENNGVIMGSETGANKGAPKKTTPVTPTQSNLSAQGNSNGFRKMTKEEIKADRQQRIAYIKKASAQRNAELAQMKAEANPQRTRENAEKRNLAGQMQTQNRQEYGIIPSLENPTGKSNSLLGLFGLFDPTQRRGSDLRPLNDKEEVKKPQKVDPSKMVSMGNPNVRDMARLNILLNAPTQEQVQAARLRKAQKEGTTGVEYEGRGNESYTYDGPDEIVSKIFGLDKATDEAKQSGLYDALSKINYHRLLKDQGEEQRTGGVDLNNLSQYSDADLFKAMSDYAPKSYAEEMVSNQHALSDYDIYNALYNEWSKRQGWTQSKEERLNNLKNYIDGLPQTTKDILGVPATAIAQFLTPLDRINMSINRQTGQPLMKGYEENLSMNDIANAIFEGVTKNYDNVNKALFGLDTSMMNSIANMTLGNGGMALMGLGSAAGTTQDALQRGVPTTDAIRLGNIAGLAETGTEIFELESLLSAFESGSNKVVKDVLMNMAKQAMNEGTSEGVSEAIQNMSDIAIAKERSNYNLSKQAYMERGMSEEEASRAAANDILKQINTSIGMGAVSGSILSGAGSAFDLIGNRKSNRIANQLEQNSLQNWAEQQALEAAERRRPMEYGDYLDYLQPQADTQGNPYENMPVLLPQNNSPVDVEGLADYQSGLNQEEQPTENTPYAVKDSYGFKSIKGYKNASTSLSQTARSYGGAEGTLDNMFRALNEYAETGNQDALNYARSEAEAVDKSLEGKVSKRGKKTIPYESGAFIDKFNKAVDKIDTGNRYKQYSNTKFEGVGDAVDNLRNLAGDDKYTNSMIDDLVSYANEVVDTNSDDAWERLINQFGKVLDSNVKFRSDEAIAKQVTDEMYKIADEVERRVKDNNRAVAENIVRNETAEVPTETPVTPSGSEPGPEEYGKMPLDLADEARAKEIPPTETYTSKAETNTLDRSGLGPYIERFKEGIESSPDAKGNKYDATLGRFDKVSEIESLTRARNRLGENLENADSETERLLDLHDKEFSSTDMDEAMMIAQHNLTRENADIDKTSRILKLIVEKSHNAGQTLQSLVKYTRTAAGTLAKGQALINDAVEEYTHKHQGQAKADARIAEKLSDINKEQTQEQTQKKAEKKEKKEKPPINQKLKNALKPEAEAKPKVEKTHEQILEEVKNTLAKEAPVTSQKFGEDDYEYIARMIEGGYTTKELRQALDTKMATGSWGISDEDVQFVVQKFNEAEEAGLDSKEGYKALSEAYTKLAERLGEEGTFMDKWNQWRYLAMLGNFRTHGRNIVSNFVFGGATSIKDTLAALGEAGYSRTKWGKGMERTKAILTHKDLDLVKGANKYFDDYAFVPATEGGNKYNDVTREIESRRRIFKDGSVVGKLADLNSKALTAEDNLAIRIKYDQALASYLKANHKTADIFDMKTQDDIDFLQKASDYAVEQAKVATFHEDNSLADAINDIEAILRSKKNPLLKYGATGVIEGLIPFKKTPANILKQGIKYTPGLGTIGTAVKAFQNMQDAANKNEFRHSASEFINDLSEQATGAIILAIGMALRKNGILRASSDDKEKDRIMGDQSYALQMGNKSFTIDWMAPAAMPLFMGAELYDSLKNDGTDIFGVMASVSEPMMEMSMMQGIRDSANSIANIINYGEDEQQAATIALSQALGYVSQGIPTLSGQIARTIDPVRRSTYTPRGNTALGAAEQWGKQQMNKIPFLSMLNEPVIDWRGEEAQSTGGNVLGRALNNFILPGYLVDNSRDELQTELERLYNAHPTDDNGEIQTMPKYYAKKNPLGENLNPEKYTQYSTDVGSFRTELLTDLMQSDVYKNAKTDVEKAKYVRQLELFADALAKGELGKEVEGKKYQKWMDMIANGDVNGIFHDLWNSEELDKLGSTSEGAQMAVDEGKQAEYQKAQSIANEYGIDSLTTDEWKTYDRLGEATFRKEMKQKGTLKAYDLSANETNRTLLDKYGEKELPYIKQASDDITSMVKGTDKWGDDTYQSFTTKLYDIWKHGGGVNGGKQAAQTYVDMLAYDANRDGKTGSYSDIIPYLKKTNMSDKQKEYLLEQKATNNDGSHSWSDDSEIGRFKKEYPDSGLYRYRSLVEDADGKGIATSGKYKGEPNKKNGTLSQSEFIAFMQGNKSYSKADKEAYFRLLWPTSKMPSFD